MIVLPICKIPHYPFRGQFVLGTILNEWHSVMLCDNLIQLLWLSSIYGEMTDKNNTTIEWIVVCEL